MKRAETTGLEVVTHESIVGSVRVVVEDGLISRVSLGESVAQFRAWCVETFGPDRTLKSGNYPRLIKALDQYFAGRPVNFDFAIKLQGTDFEMKVWAEISRVQWGRTISYAELARRIGRPNAFRAVGRACGKNPVPIMIPCHRVLTAGNKMGGYSAAGGIATKRRLLKIEGLSVEG